MFTSKSASREKSTESVSLIGKGTLITGDLESSGDIRIDGILKGNLRCGGKILIGPDGLVEGDISGNQGDILGAVKGHISMKGLLYLHGTADIQGDIHAGQLQIDATVSFNGQCRMGANVVEMNATLSSVINE